MYRIFVPRRECEPPAQAAPRAPRDGHRTGPGRHCPAREILGAPPRCPLVRVDPGGDREAPQHPEPGAAQGRITRTTAQHRHRWAWRTARSGLRGHDTFQRGYLGSAPMLESRIAAPWRKARCASLLLPPLGAAIVSISAVVLRDAISQHHYVSYVSWRETEEIFHRLRLFTQGDIKAISNAINAQLNLPNSSRLRNVLIEVAPRLFGT